MPSTRTARNRFVIGAVGVRQLARALLLTASVACAGPDLSAPVPDSRAALAPSPASFAVSASPVTGATVVALPFLWDIDDPNQKMYGFQIFGVGRTGFVTGTAFSRKSTDWTVFRWTPAAGVEDMGTLLGPDNHAAGYAINANAVVVGESLNQLSYGDDFVSMRAIRVSLPWGNCPSNCGMIDLGGPKQPAVRSGAFAINDGGQVVGDLGAIAAFWSATNVMTPLGTLGGATSSARAINRNGVVAGWSTRADGATHAFLKTIDGPMRDLGTLGGTTSTAVAISDNGIVGSSTTGSGASHAFIWTVAGGMRDLGTLPGGTSSAATGINSAGAVIGWSAVAGGATHAFYWTPAGGMQDITSATGLTSPIGLSDNFATAEGYKIYTLTF